MRIGGDGVLVVGVVVVAAVAGSCVLRRARFVAGEEGVSSTMLPRTIEVSEPEDLPPKVEEEEEEVVVVVVLMGAALVGAEVVLQGGEWTAGLRDLLRL